jgi:hypothetical protein
MPYFFAEIFSTVKEGGKSISTQKFELLKSIDEEVRKMLHKDEKVYFITSGMLTSIIEEYFISGPYAFSINGRAILFTTQRIILLQIRGVKRSKGARIFSLNDEEVKPMELRFQIPYAAIVKVNRTPLGNCRMSLKNGKTLTFAYVPKRDCEFMQKEIEKLKSKQLLSPSGAEGLENLCPYCYSTIEGYPKNCRSCWGTFKSASKAAGLSFIFPGLGDFYLGYRGFALLKIIIFSFLWIGILSGALFRNLKFLDPMAAALLFFICMHGINAIWTHHIAKKGIYPTEKKDQASSEKI